HLYQTYIHTQPHTHSYTYRHTHTHTNTDIETHNHTVKDRSRRPSHHVGCSLVEWGCRQEHTTQETVASIKIAIFIYNRVFVKPQNIPTQTENTKAYTRQGTPLSI